MTRSSVLYDKGAAPVKKGKVQSMSTKDINKTVKEIKELTRMKEEIETEIKRQQDDIKAEMVCRGVHELSTDEYKIKWTAVVSNRFDTFAFKKIYGDLYRQFTKQTESMRFSIV